MCSKVNIKRYGIILIVFAIGIFFIISGYSLLKYRKENSNASKNSVVINESDTPSVSDNKANNSSVTVNNQETATTNSNANLSKAELQTIALKSELNNYVLNIIPDYEGGKYPYLLNNDYANYNGVTENIVYQNSMIAKANPDGSKSSHCVGLTYEVFFKAMQQRNKEAGISPDNFNNMTAAKMKDFLLTWYAAQGKPKAEGNQLAGAIVKYGLGTQITKLQDAKAGDFIDFSRTKSGHTAVFIEWLKDERNNIIGFKYWSTQESTNGIGYKKEYFSDNPQGTLKGTVNRNQLYIGRIGSIANYNQR